MFEFYEKFRIQPMTGGDTPTPTPKIYNADEKITGNVVDSVTFTQEGE